MYDCLHIIPTLYERHKHEKGKCVNTMQTTTTECDEWLNQKGDKIVNAQTMIRHYKFKDTKTLELLVKVHTHHVDESCILSTNV
jgi:hypothetical protein